MAKFNQTNTNKTVNKSGHAAYAMKDKAKLVTQVLTTFFGEEKYYGNNDDELLQTAEKVLNSEPKFVANLARYARKEMHLRSVSHALAALIAHNENGKPFIKEVVADVVERADDITEILACYLGTYGKPVPNGLKKALGAAIGRFNAYQLSKYNGGNKSVKFRDVLRIAHPRPTSKEQEELFKMVLEDTLPIAERWETELSANGNTTEVWEKLIAEKKLGYMAMLRNLRNLLNANPANIDAVYETLADKTQALQSKQLPFRFFSAYREVQPIATSKALDVLETAIEYSIENLPRLKGKTVIAIDTSGSMHATISHRSSVHCEDIARLMAVLASRICEEYVVYSFDTKLKKVTFSKKGGIIQTALDIPVCGGGTDLLLPLKQMLADNLYADRLIMLSDNEINSGWCGIDYYYGLTPKKGTTCQVLADEYRKTINKNLWIHAIDLQGYGTQQFIGGKTNIIAGWSERLLEFIALAEEGLSTQVKKIEKYA